MNSSSARDAEGEIIHRLCDEHGREIAVIRRLSNNLLAVDVLGDDALALAKAFLPKTRVGVKTLATGEKSWRFLYTVPTLEANELKKTSSSQLEKNKAL